MIEVSVPKDVFKRKNKVMGAFTALQLISIICGLALALLSYLLFKWVPILFVKVILCAIPAVICFIIGFLPIQNEPFLKIFPRILNDNFIAPTKRYKEINNQWKKPIITTVKNSKEYRKVK